MKLILNSEKTALTTSDPTLPVIATSCVVRNEVNKQRGGQEVVYTIPGHRAYMPRVFPKGSWKLGTLVAKTDPYLAPWFIPTNAWQMVSVWDVDAQGFYLGPTKETIRDEGYGLHCSTSRTTLGCLKIAKKSDLLWLVQILSKEEVILEVQ